MSRPIVLIDIGAGPLPAVTPVVTQPASWVPVPYVAPPPPAPASMVAESISDGVLLTWTHPDNSVTFRIERAPDAGGSPGGWELVGHSNDRRYTINTPSNSVEGFYFRIRAEKNGRPSEWTTPIFAWPWASNPPVQVLTISNHTITIDGRYTRFTLLLDKDVHYVSFQNFPQEKTVIVEVTQSGGGNVLTWPSWVQSITGVPYKASSVNGATDVVGLITENAARSFRMTFQQPEGGGSAFAITLSPSPAYAQVIYDGTAGVAPVQQVNAAVANGVAPVVLSWTRDDAFGGDDFNIDDDTSASPTFSLPAGSNNIDRVQIWRVTATDDLGRQVQALVTVRLQRVVALEDLSSGLINPDFELGNTGWDLGSSLSIGTNRAYAGTHSLRLDTDFTGTTEAVNQFAANVNPGDVIRGSCMVHQGASDIGRTLGFARIKFYNAANELIENRNGNVVNDGATGVWLPSIVEATAPAGTTKARLAGVLQRTGQNHPMHLDTFTWSKVSGGSAAGLIITTSPNPAYAEVVIGHYDPATAVSLRVTASAAGAVAPLSWSWVCEDDGGMPVTINGASAHNPLFTLLAGRTTVTALQVWRVTVSDGAGRTGTALVDITLRRRNTSMAEQ